LRDRLPPEFAPLFDNLGQRQNTSSRGRANIFLSTLANTLEPGHFDRALPDEAWCKTFSPAELLAHPAIKAGWKAPSRILDLLEGAGGGRNSATASFDLAVGQIGFSLPDSRHGPSSRLPSAGSAQGPKRPSVTEAGVAPSPAPWRGFGAAPKLRGSAWTPSVRSTAG